MKKALLWTATVSVAVILFFLSELRVIMGSVLKLLLNWEDVWPNLVSLGAVSTIVVIMLAIMKIVESPTGQKN